MSKAPSPPAPPNPVTVANAQTGTNIGTAVAQSQLGNVNQITPYGSTTFNNSGGYTDPTTGQWVPQTTETTTLSPLEQAILSGTQSTGASLMPVGQNLANTAGNVTTGHLNLGGANEDIINAGPQALDPTVAKAVYNEQTGFLQPTYAQQQKDLQDQLSRQGISVGSDAYGNAEAQLANTQNQGYTAAANNATAQGAQTAGNLFNLALLGQQQGVGQQIQQQQLPLMLLSQIYGGAPSQAAAAA